MKKYFIISILVLMSVVWGIYVFYLNSGDGYLKVHFFDLYRGRSVLIRTASDKVVLVGAGQNTEVIKKMTSVLPFFSRSIDFLVIPSAAVQQIGGTIDLLERYEIKNIIFFEPMATSTVLSEIQKKVRKKKIKTTTLSQGDVLKIDEGLEMNILFPKKEFKYNKTSLPEAVIRFKYHNVNAFLFGDVSKTVQKDISKNLKLNSQENISEYFNTMNKAKISEELRQKISAKYIFNNNEKDMRLRTKGEKWEEF